MKRILALLLCFALCLSLLPASFAEDIEIIDPETEEPELVLIDDKPTVIDGMEIHVNPLYRDVLSAEELAVELHKAEPAASSTTCATLEEAASALRAGMKARSETISIHYTGGSLDYNEAIDLAMAHTGNPTEGDYILWQYGGWGMSGGGGEYNFNLTYYTTAAQESEMNSAVSSVISSLKLSGKSDYQKTCAIYDYVCDNVVYDHAHVSTPSYRLQFTAYAALINGTAVCQGYANLLYRLLLTAGVDTRIVTSSNHAWNIVGLGEYYYNVDSTWDAGNSVYSWFLKCMAHFPDHEREEPYCEDPFYEAYPMSPTDYAANDGPVRFSKSELILYVGGASEDVSYTIGSGVSYASYYISYSSGGSFTFDWNGSTLTVKPENAGGGFISLVLEDSSGNAVASGTLYVTVLAQKIEINKKSLSIPVFKTASVSLRAADGSAVSARWTSSNRSVATVDSKGVITAHKYGKATITGTAEGGNFTCQVQTLFWDVADSSKYYYKHVYWAAEKGITKGYDLEYFDPQGECTREQMMTFLWRLAGKPNPKTTTCPFPDVPNGAYYYKAVLWGVEKKITAGFSEGEYAGKFGVGLPCTREQAMTFLWRMADKPEPMTTTNMFSDVESDDYFYKAVLWASENGIAKGYSDGTYGVGLDCLREHMVTFLSRYASKFM